MARTVTEIKKSLTDYFIGNATIITKYGLAVGLTFAQQFSIVSLESILFDTVAYGMQVLEGMWDIFRAEITSEMAKNQPHTKDWYRNKALGFVLGAAVADSQGNFDTSGLTDEELEAAMVIKQAAAVKLINQSGYGTLRLKVATSGGGGLIAVPDTAFVAFKAYILQYILDAGTQIAITTGNGDDLKLTIDVYYDPLVLTPQGARIDGTNASPVQDAVQAFLSALDFNGTLNTKRIEAALQNVEGVLYANVTDAASKYGSYTYDTEDIQNVGVIDVFRTADSGYFLMDELHLNFKLAE